MSKSTKLIAGLGVVAALGMAVMPLAGAFAEASVTGTPADVTVAFEIEDSLAMSIVDGSVVPSAHTVISAGDSLDTKTSDVKITGNTNYRVTVIDKDTNNALDNGAGGTVAAFSNTTASALTSTGWGLALNAAMPDANHTSDLVVSTSGYKGVDVSTGTALKVVERTNTAASFTDDTTTVKYGIKTASDQPSGVYEDTITYTLAAI